jgi:hypothetical protein
VHLHVYAALFAVSRALSLAELCVVLTAALSAALLAVSRARSACWSQGRPKAGAPPLAPAPVHLHVYAALFAVSRALSLAELCVVLTAVLSAAHLAVLCTFA